MDTNQIQTVIKTGSSTEITKGLVLSSLAAKQTDAHPSDVRIQESTAMQFFLAWEKFRILYNVVMFLFAVLLTLTFSQSDVLPPVSIFAITVPIILLAANIFFCVAPVAEGYLCWFGVQRLLARRVVVVVMIILICLAFAISLAKIN